MTECAMCSAANAGWITLRQNIGMLVARQTKTVRAPLCQACAGNTYARFTLVNLVVGWWGLISIIVTPFNLVANALAYFRFAPSEGSGNEAVQPMAPIHSPPAVLVGLVALLAGAYAVMSTVAMVRMMSLGLVGPLLPYVIVGIPALVASVGLLMVLRNKTVS